MIMSEHKRDLYKASGVDVEKGDALVDWLQEDRAESQQKYGHVVSGIGGFAALYRPQFQGMVDPLLVSSTDGVGTKVLLGLETGKLEGLGIDLVAMCVNDLYTIGGVPLFFLDYFATGVLDQDQFKQVLSGIKNGLRQASTSLLGGETAELPGLYAKGHFDLAGFVVGVVDAPKKLGAEKVRVGDVLMAFESSGFHSNGYSLVRRWLAEQKADAVLIDRIMTPTKIYSAVPALLEQVPDAVHALANITGGGISGNLPRVMPDSVVCQIQQSALPTPEWMAKFCHDHGATFAEVEGVYNMGAGMIAAVAEDAVDQVLQKAKTLNMPGCRVGRVGSGQGAATVQFT